MARSYQFDPNDPAVRATAEIKVFGHEIMNNDVYADLVGDVAGDASVRVIFNRFNNTKNKVYPITISADSSLHTTVVRLDKDEFDYSDCTVKSKGHQHGRPILALLATTARAQGFTQIKAAGSKFTSLKRPELSTYGYYVYAKYGFDAPIPPNILATLPDDLKGATHLRHLMTRLEGRKHWKAEGPQMNDMTFELKEGSDSWATFDAGY